MNPRDGDAAPRHDWSARARSTAMDALRYTQFVGVMKRALPAAAFAVIAAVLAFFFVARQPSKIAMTYEKLGRIQNDLAMEKPRLTGADGNGNPFVITADQAIQDAKNPKKAKLKKVEADLTLDNNGWLNANAANGLVDMKVGSLELGGGIDVFSDSGYTLHSQAASLDLNKWILHGHNEVTGQGPMGTMRADSFHYDRASHKLALDGHVRMTLIGNHK
ncbi:MAG TPA: LPS export ABC transporter periplasmic protein LptC [Rhizomicrobium sp.]|jgi:lipopolysaccharide export system protein LptC|nr:LPS export ABC transporter periplasmic protein LptC [Rhizomicrobium sp.]